MKRGLALLLMLSLSAVIILSVHNLVEGQQIDQLSNFSSRATNNSQRLYNAGNNLFGLAADKFKYKLLNTKFIGAIDKGLQKISVIFKILMGEPYSFSFAFLMVLIIWLYFWSSFSTLISSFTSFSNLASWAIGLGMNILLAQTKLYSWIGHALSDLIFSLSLGWQLAILVLFILILLYLRKLIVMTRKMIRDYKKRRLEEYNRMQAEFAAKRAEAVINPYVDALSEKPAPVDERFRFDPNAFKSPSNPSIEEDDGERHRGGGGD